VSDSEERRDEPAPPSEGSADEEYARSFSEGYEEGVRNALREVLEHASRGHTAQELRMLIESRLARLPEEVELKRRSLLGPPRRPAWGSLFRAPQAPQPWTPPSPRDAPRIVAGGSYLVREERPQRALALIAEAQARFARLVTVSLRPPRFDGVPTDRRLDIRLGTSGTPEAGVESPLSPGTIGGRLREPMATPGGALVYLDAVEFLVSENSFETTLRFVHWTIEQAEASSSALVVSLDPRALEAKDLSRLQRLFHAVV
jgi:hypothetical protein